MKRFRGTNYSLLLSRLPRNLVIFDGHCLLCQARVRYVLERNFNYFGYLSYVRGTESAETENHERLDRHRMYFTSLGLPEGAQVARTLKCMPPAASSTPSRAADAAPGSAYEMDLVVVFVEKVPSRESFFLRRMGARASGRHADDLMDTLAAAASSTTAAAPAATRRRETETGDQARRSSALTNPKETDLLVSTNFTAMCRIGMRLDRWLPSCVFTLAFYAVPKAAGDWWFRRFVSVRRHTIWGTSEKDAVVEPKAIEGMRERRWTMNYGSGSAKVKR
ncbi:hypothetical protein STCU_04355 [Strigomonas culicis]|uniref:Uncharacterized protein n=1 Tax=Strigomonas culicis TaxID=28005 RepID=S9VRI7_9TRYP|nr:hypothetical protein STCU_04355 [Strigomonas culicis]|eukprot:EPY29666.1 hypothetical protein STCU_04355 [Strigomonas culicis]